MSPVASFLYNNFMMKNSFFVEKTKRIADLIKIVALRFSYSSVTYEYVYYQFGTKYVEKFMTLEQ